jgi:hypothetical protein
MICNTASALKELFEHSKDTLPVDKLEWLGGLLDCAELQSDNLASMLETLAVCFSDSDTSFVPNEKMALVLWGLSHKAETISAMVTVAQEAEYLAKKHEATDNA